MRVPCPVTRGERADLPVISTAMLGPEPAAVAPPEIQLGFSDFWEGFDPEDNFFTRILRRRYRVQISDNPDFLIHSCFGKEYLRYTCTRIFYTGENRRADWYTTDWAFTFDYTSHPRHFRLPLWPLYTEAQALVKRPDFDPDGVAARKTRFCAFVVSNPLCRVRNTFFRRLSQYKPVDSGGAVLNTLGYRVGDKRAFLRDYKFTIAFENSSRAGYTTEKLVEPMLANSIPIYWGDPLVGRDFDSRSFLSAHDVGSLDALIDQVVEADRDADRYGTLLSHPWLRNNRVPTSADPEVILAQFQRIFETPITPVATRGGLARRLHLHRVPGLMTGLRNRAVWEFRKRNRNA
jgi:alpha(1,3/1,4) fucosyltransferase